MTIRSLGDSATEHVDLHADICVIGAGIAGLIVARRLMQHGVSVVHLESGAEGVSDEAQSLNAIDAEGSLFTSAVGGRFRGLGGSSSRWGGRFLPLTRYEVGGRAHVGLEAWPVDLDEIDRYLSEVEDLFSLDHSSFTASEQLTSQAPAGKPDHAFDLREPKWAPFKYCNLGDTLRGEIEAAQTWRLHLDSTVTGFEFDPAGRVAAVLATSRKGPSARVAAREFVVAAGAIESARLLLQADSATEGRAFGECAALGRYLQDHVGLRVATIAPTSRTELNRRFGYRFAGSMRRSLHLEMTPELQARERVAAAFAHVTVEAPDNSPTQTIKRLMRSRQSHERPSRQELLHLATSSNELLRGAYWRAVHKQHFWPTDLTQHLNVWIEQLPRAENRITLSDRADAVGSPMARIHWQTGVDEASTARACIKHLAGYWERSGLSNLGRIDWQPWARDPASDFSAQFQQLYHPSGATRMGTNPRESVVGPDLLCHALPNVRVVSASTFPSAGATGPTLTLAMLAFRAADAIKASR